MDMSQTFYIGAVGLVLLGIAGVVFSTHLIRIILAIALLEAGVNLLLLLASFREEARAPIMVNGEFPALMADPITQALVLTAIVIGVGVLALALSLALRLNRAYGTLDIRKIRQLMEKDIAMTAGVDLPVSGHAPANSSDPGG